MALGSTIAEDADAIKRSARATTVRTIGLAATTVPLLVLALWGLHRLWVMSLDDEGVLDIIWPFAVLFMFVVSARAIWRQRPNRPPQAWTFESDCIHLFAGSSEWRIAWEDLRSWSLKAVPGLTGVFWLTLNVGDSLRGAGFLTRGPTILVSSPSDLARAQDALNGIPRFG